jgi:hypothetical protein
MEYQHVTAKVLFCGVFLWFFLFRTARQCERDAFLCFVRDMLFTKDNKDTDPSLG